MLDERGIQRRTEQVIRDFDVRPPNAALPARALSGGNQQKLIIGGNSSCRQSFCWFRNRRAVLISARLNSFTARLSNCAIQAALCCWFRLSWKK